LLFKGMLANLVWSSTSLPVPSMFNSVTHRLRTLINFSIFFIVAVSFAGQAYGQAGAFPAITLDSTSTSFQSLVAESAGGGYASVRELRGPQRPAGLLRVAEDQRHLIWVELARGRMHILEKQSHGGFITRKILPVSIGKNGYGKEVEGDRLTPIGVYRLTSFLEDNRLDDFYGNGAYPMNYPNAHDRLMKRTGHGIWLHGLPKDMTERPLLDSDGCVVVDNDAFDNLAEYIKTGSTFIVLSEGEILWEPADSYLIREAQLSSAFEQWRSDWESIDNNAYLAHYGEDFSDFRQNLAEWSAYKRRVNNAKTFITVATSNVSFIADPRDAELVNVRFYQSYRSSNYNWDGWKEQLWRDTADGWKIIYEGNG
jgi:murein L,D-transpeptidase YafK